MDGGPREYFLLYIKSTYWLAFFVVGDYMKVKTIQKYYDREKSMTMTPGTIIEVSEERARYLITLGFVEAEPERVKTAARKKK